MNRPGDATNLSAEERAAWVARVKETFAEKRARGEITSPPSPEERLEELSQDDRAGRDLKLDLRVNGGEKRAWYQAADAMGLSVSEFVRDVVNQAAEEVLASESVEV